MAGVSVVVGEMVARRAMMTVVVGETMVRIVIMVEVVVGGNPWKWCWGDGSYASGSGESSAAGAGGGCNGGASGGRQRRLRDEDENSECAHWDDVGRQILPLGGDADPRKHRTRGYSPGGFGTYPAIPTVVRIAGNL